MSLKTEVGTTLLAEPDTKVKVFLDVHNGYLYIITGKEWAQHESIIASRGGGGGKIASQPSSPRPQVWPLIPVPLRYCACRSQVETWFENDVNASFWRCKVLELLFLDLVEKRIVPPAISRHVRHSIPQSGSVELEVLLLTMEGMPILHGADPALTIRLEEEGQPAARDAPPALSVTPAPDFGLWESTAFVPLLDRLQRHVDGPRAEDCFNLRSEEEVLAQGQHFSQVLSESDNGAGKSTPEESTTGKKESNKPCIRRLRFKEMEPPPNVEATVVVVDYTAFSVTCSIVCRSSDGRREESLPLWTAPREITPRTVKDVDRILQHYRLVVEDFEPSTRHELAELFLIPPEGLVSPERLQELAGVDTLVLVEDTVFPAG